MILNLHGSFSTFQTGNLSPPSGVGRRRVRRAEGGGGSCSICSAEPRSVHEWQLFASRVTAATEGAPGGRWKAGGTGKRDHKGGRYPFNNSPHKLKLPLCRQGVPRDSTRLLQPAPRPRGNGNAQAAGLWLFIRRGQGRLPGQDDSLDDGRGGSSGPASSAAAARRATEGRAETGPWGSAAGQWRGGACPSIVAVSLSLPQW